MPAAIPIALAVSAASVIYQGVQANQDRQHAKGAAQAQDTAMAAEADAATKADAAAQKSAADLAASSRAASANALGRQLLARRQSTILTDPSADERAPIATKTLLGA